MNMLRLFTQIAYDRCLDELHRSIQAEANDSLQKVAEKTYAENRYGDNENDPAKIALFHLMDRGRPGFSSCNGVVTCMSGSKY